MTLFVLSGLPGSGKTTIAKDMCTKNPNLVRVNKDDIRRELEGTGWTWSKEAEKKVLEIRDTLIKRAFEEGKDVVSDDTNFGKHFSRMSAVARAYGANVVERFIATPVEECVRRDSLREGKAKVGENVIRKMFCQHVAPPPEACVFKPVGPRNVFLEEAVMCDLDGTLALFDGMRSPYDASTCDKDRVNYPVLTALAAMHFVGNHILYTSGRSEDYRAQTETFLKLHKCPPGQLLMRKTGDLRKDWIVKGELYDAHIRDKFNVLFVLDDRDQVVNFWRKIGLTCFQVAPGDF